ncbi:hypothetical protein M422DRAFT_157986 [Sphaerobolus stellatus SS14]|nr:hypothetical protein M422DRAFT_157986 [Sphaerobolus stellatus SS14]
MPSKQPPQRKKAVPKEPLSAPERIRRHFKSLVAQLDGGHLTNAIKTCDKILRLDPKDEDALETKLALLLQTDQYGAALSLAETLLSDKEHQAFTNLFGKAYALYRLNREPEAAELVQTIKPEGIHEERGVLHMEAQIEYRRGNYQKAQELYSHIFDTSTPHSDEQTDSLTNLNAAQSHLDFLQSGFLRSLHELPQAVLNSIEEASPPSIVPPNPILTTATAAAAQPALPKEKPPRKSRLPRNYVAGVTPPPDPERWIKKSERTNQHHGKRRKGAANATQGAAVVETSSKGGGGKGKKRK